MNRTCISLAIAAALGTAGGALANPTGAEVVQGAAAINASGKTLTVVPTVGAIIDWRSFVIAPDETTRFLQSSPSATVINRILSTEFGLYGRLEANSRVLLMQSGRVFGDGVALDLPGINFAALQQPRPVRPTTRDVDRRAAGAAARNVVPWVVMIVPETMPVSAGAGVLLPSGMSAELADARWPHVRVLITAPPGQPLDVTQLLRKSGELGIFGSLLAVPRGRSAEGADEPLLVANAEVTPLAVAPPALPDAAPAADLPIQVALQDEMPLPKPLASGDDDIAAPAIVLAEVRPPAPVLLAKGDDDIAAPVVALAEVRPPAPVLLAKGDDDIAAPVIALAEVRPPAPVLLAKGDDDIAAPVVALAKVRPPAPVLLAKGDDDIAAPVVALAKVRPPAPVLLAKGDDDIAAPVVALAAAPQAVPQPALASVRAEPAAAPSAPVIVASAETPYRRVALVASDTPVWPAPVKLERVERRIPVIMFDRKGGIFHL